MMVEIRREEISWMGLERSTGEKEWVAGDAIPALSKEADMLVFV